MDPDKQTQDINIQITKKFKDIRVNLSKLKKLTKAICEQFELSKATVSIAIVDNIEIRKINRKFLNSNHITDCISFDLSDDVTKSFELVVNGEKAVKQAKLRGHPSQAELALYITHGLLHNLGFNDSDENLAKKMHNTEDEILKQQGFGVVYNNNSS
ncbi:MAG: rRNA maturation RNase YbeY [Planctomycetes bacterium]|nr:rRNA maturation RNase YbeY [Planctomycetota bacterium]